MTLKTLRNSDASPAELNVPDLIKAGDPDRWLLICKASSEREGWMKSTKAMEVPGGCLVQVTTQQRTVGGHNAIAEALTFVPGVRVVNARGVRYFAPIVG